MYHEMHHTCLLQKNLEHKDVKRETLTAPPIATVCVYTWIIQRTKNHFRNECEYGCPEHTHCEWGFCECDPGYVKAWGICRLVREGLIEKTPDSGVFLQEGFVAPEPGRRYIEGLRCDSTAECQTRDVNLVCRCLDWICRRFNFATVNITWLLGCSHWPLAM